MALQLIYSITFTADSFTYSSGDVIDVYRDDSSVEPLLEVQLNSSVITSGGTIGDPSSYTVSNALDQTFWWKSQYSYCNGSILQEFRLFNFASFPFTQIDSIADSPQCDITVVCDLMIDSVSITNTTAGGANGEIQATASTSATGDIYYSLQEPFSYTGSNISGLFTGLTAGTYTIWTIDSNGCKQFRIVEIQNGLTYATKYLLDFEDTNKRQINVNIEEENFSGSQTEVTGGGTPFMRSLRGETAEKYGSQIYPSEAEISLDSETNFQYKEFIENDERRYRITELEDDSGLQLRWRGYVKPEEYSEAYIQPGYAISLIAIDNLASLSKYDFLDNSGNRVEGIQSLMAVISLILSKTDLEFSIRSVINKFEENHNSTASDDPLTQTYIDPSVYYDEEGVPEKCDIVLANILQPFGAFVRQSHGYWWLIDIQELKKDSLTYREFDKDGQYLSNGTFNHLIDHKGSTLSNRVVMADQTGQLDYQPVYQAICLNQILGLENNVFKNGSFKDLQINESGIPVSLKNWDYKLNADTGTAPNATQNILGESMTSFIVGQGNSYISQSFTMTAGVNDEFAFSFKYFLREYGTTDTLNGNLLTSTVPLYLRVRYRVNIGNYYLKANGGWTTTITDVLTTSNEYGQINEIEIQSEGLPASVLGQPCEVRFYSTYPVESDYEADNSVSDMFTNLRAIATTSLSVGQFIIGANKKSDGLYDLFYYELVEGTDAEEGPTSSYNKFRPNDYTDSTNEKFWQNQEPNGRFRTLIFLPSAQPDRAVRFGSSELKYLPQGEEPADENEIKAINYQASLRRASNVFETEVFHGDILSRENAFRFVYKNYFRLADGTPTFYWSRSGITERRTLLDILSSEIANEHRTAKNRLTISVTNLGSAGTDFDFISVLRETQDNSKKYMAVGVSKDSKYNMDQLELLELAGTEDGIPPGEIEFAGGETDESVNQEEAG